jgi:hypothetical protein
MALANFLGDIGAVFRPQAPGPIGGFGGGTFGMDGAQVTPTGALLNLNGITSADVALKHLAGPRQAPQAPPQQQPPQEASPGRRKGVKHFLGVLGDALLTGAGGDPIYGPERERAELGAQLAAYVGTDNPELARIFAENPEAGMALYNASREDRRFDRTAGQDDRRIGIGEGQLDLGRDELGERKRSNQASEGLTERGQNISATTQVQLQQMRQQEAAAGRAFDAAMRRGDREHAERMLGLQQQFQREIAVLEGGGAYEETVTETPGAEAEDGWFSDTPATPTTKTVVRRPITSQSQAPSQADIEFTAQKHGITVEEVKRRLGIN